MWLEILELNDLMISEKRFFAVFERIFDVYLCLLLNLRHGRFFRILLTYLFFKDFEKKLCWEIAVEITS